MRKLFTAVALMGLISLGATPMMAQEAENAPVATALEQDSTTAAVETPAIAEEESNEVAEQSLHHALKTKFIEGGPGFMATVLLCLILGLAVAIERIIYLSLASVNTKKLLTNVENALQSGGVEAAKKVCADTRGPVASIFFQGLDRIDVGVDAAEKAVVSYGSVQVGKLESGLSWIGLFIGVAPMFGFMGTVIGMIGAFDSIEAAGDISPTLVAGGIKVALITTVFGLVVAIILQFFYNYILSKIDKISNDMEDASISLMDILVKYNLKK